MDRFSWFVPVEQAKVENAQWMLAQMVSKPPCWQLVDLLV